MEEGLGSKGKRLCSQNFFSIAKGAAFQWVGKINTNPNKQHKDECMLPGTWGSMAHNEVCVGGAGRKLSLAGTMPRSLGKRGERFSDGGKNRKNLLVLAILLFFLCSSCCPNTRWFPNMVVKCPPPSTPRGSGHPALNIRGRCLGCHRRASYRLWLEIQAKIFRGAFSLEEKPNQKPRQTETTVPRKI